MSHAMTNLLQASEAALQSLRENGNRILAEWLEAAIEEAKREAA